MKSLILSKTYTPGALLKFPDQLSDFELRAESNVILLAIKYADYEKVLDDCLQ